MADNPSAARVIPSSVADWSLEFQQAARRSTYTLKHGDHSTVYYDVASFFLGLRNSEEYTVDRAKVRSTHGLGEIIANAMGLCDRKEIGRLAFIERGKGEAIGILPAMTTFLQQADLRSCIVRPRKRLKLERILGPSISPGEKILLVSDVATTGRTLVEAARCLKDAGGTVEHAFVIYDRDEGARARLAGISIELHAFDDQDQYRAVLRTELEAET